MRTSRVIHMVSCHAEAEFGDAIAGGAAPPLCGSLWEQCRWIAGTRQHLPGPDDPWPQGYRLADTWPSEPALSSPGASS